MGWYGYKSHSENPCAEGEKLCAKHPFKKQPEIETLLNDIYYRSVDKLCIKVTIKVNKASRPSLFIHCQFGIFLWFLWYYLSCFLIWLELNVFDWKPWSWWCPIYVWSQDGVVRTFLCLFDLKHVYHCLKNTKQPNSIMFSYYYSFLKFETKFLSNIFRPSANFNLTHNIITHITRMAGRIYFKAAKSQKVTVTEVATVHRIKLTVQRTKLLYSRFTCIDGLLFTTKLLPSISYGF